MLDQVSSIAHVPGPSVEQLRQRRLAYFTATHQHKHPMSQSEAKSLQRTEDLHGEEKTVSQLNINYSHSENNDIAESRNYVYVDSPQVDKRLYVDSPQVDKRLYEDSLQVDKRPTCWSEESMKLEEKSFQRHHDDSWDLKGCSDHHCHMNQELFVGGQQQMFADTSSEDFNLHAEISQRSKSNLHNSDFATSRREGRKVQGFFSEKIAEEIRSVLGEEGLQNIMENVARDLKQLNQERPNPLHISHLNKKELDSTYDVMNEGSTSSSASLKQSLGLRNKECSDMSSFNPVECKTPSLMSSTITRNLQQLREGENETITLARNYDQVTVPTTTKNAFSSEEIYRQAFSGHTDRSDKQHNGHTYTEVVPYNWQEKHAFSQHSPERRSSYPNNKSGQSPPPHFHPLMNQNNMFSISPPQPHLYFDPLLHPLCFPSSPSSPTSNFIFQDETQLFHNQPYRITNNHLPQQHCQDLNQKYTSYKPSLPAHPPTVFQPPPRSYFYPPPACPDPQRGVMFLTGTPVHLPPPPAVPVNAKHHSFMLQQQLPPHLPASSRQQNSTAQPGSPLKGLPDFVLGGQFVRAPHPPLVPPALQSRIESQVSPHRFELRRLSDGNASASPKHQPKNRDSENYTLQRYFSSLEMYNRCDTRDDVTAASLEMYNRCDTRDDVTAAPLEMYNRCDTRDDVTAASSDKPDHDPSEADDEARTTFTDFTGASTEKIGGLTQRLQDLDINLDHLNHLRLVNEARRHPQASGNTEVFPERIKRCPECSSLNKAYMDWCVGCGEMLIGVETTVHKTSHQLHRSQQKEKSMKTSGPDRGRTCVSYAVGADMECQDRKFVGERSLESGGDPSPSGFSVQPQLEGITSSLDERVVYGNPLQEKNVKKELPERAYDKQKDTVLVENDKKDKESDLDADNSLLEEIEDPLIREFAISYRKRQLLQQHKKGSGQVAHKTSKKYSVKSDTTSGGYSGQNVDISVADTSIVATSIAATSIVATSVVDASFVPSSDATSQASASTAATLSSSTPEAVKSFTSAAWKEDAIDKGQNLSCNVAVPVLTSSYTVPAPRSSLESSAAERGQVKNVANLLPFVAHVETTIHGNTESGTDQHQVNKNRDLRADVSNQERKMMKKKKKKRLKGETVDIEIFAYSETRKSPQATNRVVPVLNLKSSSDEEDSGDNDDDDDDDDDNSEAQSVKDNITEVTASSDFNKQINISNPAHSHHYNKTQLIRNHKNLPLAKSSQSQPMQATNTSSPQPSFSKSGASFHHNKSRGGFISGPARYQRHWTRSSIAWSSFNPRELSTRSSLGTSQSIPRRGASGAPGLIQGGRGQQEANRDVGHSAVAGQRRPSSAGTRQRRPASELHQRPVSASVSRRRERPQIKPPATLQEDNFQGYPPSTPHGDSFPSHPPSTPHGDSFQGHSHGDSFRQNGEVTSDKDSPRLLCAELHRLPQKDVGEEHSGCVQAVAMEAYLKLQEMTPRIAVGEMSQWQCLPDEIWLYIFSFLSKRELINVMVSSKYFSRLANDQTLWKYITVRPKYSMTDQALARIAQHRPVSLAMTKCQGSQVTPECLQDFFRQIKDRLKELNISGCSQGSLVGTEVLKAASLCCQKITHLDASFCNVTDTSLIAMCRCADRLESVCLNGFQSMNDSTLLFLLKKHGKSLRTLELYACFSLTAFGFVSIGQHCNRLRRLCLGSCNKLTDAVVTRLSVRLKHIEELDLRGCNNLKDDCICKIANSCPRLHTLVLANCHLISNYALFVVAINLKATLRVLDVCGCDGVTDDGVTSLVKYCGHLTTLDISSTKCTEASVQQLADSSCRQYLETVRFSFLTLLTEACLNNFIHQCPRLKSIHVFGCSSLKNMARPQPGNRGLLIEGDSFEYTM